MTKKIYCIWIPYSTFNSWNNFEYYMRNAAFKEDYGWNEHVFHPIVF